VLAQHPSTLALRVVSLQLVQSQIALDQFYLEGFLGQLVLLQEVLKLTNQGNLVDQVLCLDNLVALAQFRKLLKVIRVSHSDGVDAALETFVHHLHRDEVLRRSKAALPLRELLLAELKDL